MIVRAPRHERDFTILSNRALRDELLSFRARGLLAYILSQKPGWTVSAQRLADVATEGREAVRTALAELEAAGYLRRTQERAADGTIKPVAVVYEDPQPFPENPSPVPPAETDETAGHTDARKPVSGCLIPEGLTPKDYTNPPPPTGSVVALNCSGDEQAVFDAWVQSTGKTRSALDSKRRRLIRGRLADGYAVEDLCLAVTGWQFSPHHRGENDRGTVYNDLGLILRDADHVDAFLEYARTRSGGGRVTSGRDPLSGVREFLADRAEEHSFVGEVGRG